MKKLAASLIITTLLLVATVGIVSAWPAQPPEKATISGPGLKGEVQITDSEALRTLRLGSLEDFDAGAIVAPQVGDGYKIMRWFYKGTFNFGQLRYYPGAEDHRGYVYFEDGPDIEGGPTPYNGEWFYTTRAGDAAMQRLLRSLGVASISTKHSSKSSFQGDNPSLGTTSSKASEASNLINVSAPIQVIALVAGLGLLLLAGSLVAWRRRRHSA